MVKKNEIANWIIANMLENIDTITGKWNNGQVQPVYNINLNYRNGATNHIYTGYNPFACSLHCIAHGFTSNVYYSMNQAKKLKLRIKESELKNSVMLTWYKSMTFNDKNNPDKKITIPLLRYYKVYNIDQIEDSEYKEKQIKKHSNNAIPQIVEENKKIEKIESIINEYVIRENSLDIVEFNSTGTPCYIPNTDTVRIPVIEFYKSNIRYYESKIHECIHSTGHDSRLKRPMNGMGNKSQYAMEELIAEFGVAYFCSYNNVEYDAKNILLYIKSWLGSLKDDPTQIIKAASKSTKAVDYIMGDM